MRAIKLDHLIVAVLNINYAVFLPNSNNKNRCLFFYWQASKVSKASKTLSGVYKLRFEGIRKCSSTSCVGLTTVAC